MVELYGLIIIKRIQNKENHKHVILSGKILIPWYAIAANKTIKKIASEFGKIVASRVTLGETNIYTHIDKKHKKYKIIVTTRHNGLIGILVTDEDYSNRISFTIVQNILDKFEAKYNVKKYDKITKMKDYCVSQFNTECRDILKANKDPSKTDNICIAMKEVKDIGKIMEQNIDKLLNRGEKLENLLDKTIELESDSYDFYVAARKLRCCKIL